MAAEEKANTEATPKPAAPEVKAAAAPEAKPAPAAPAPAAPAAAEAKPVVEKQTNCLACNKALKKLKRYYRDGKYYCTKKCWINHTKKPKEEEK